MVDNTAKADIVNATLIALGKETVADLSDASLAASLSARKVLQVVERARKTVLRRLAPACALEYVRLYPSPIPNLAFNPRYPSTFLLPGDAVRVWEIEGVSANAGAAPGAGAPFSAWEPRWQVGTTEINGSTQIIIRGAVGPGEDGTGQDWAGGYPGGPDFSADTSTASLAFLDPVVYVRLADWQSLDDDLKDLVAYEAAALAAYAVTADMAVQGKLDQYVMKKMADAIGADVTQEGGQPEVMGSIPAMLRNFSR